MNAEMRMYQALEHMPEAITDYAAKVNHIADWADVTWAAAEVWLRDWQNKQEASDALDRMQQLGQECDNGAEVPYNGGEGVAWLDKVAEVLGEAVDPINPAHYQSESGVEAIDAILAALGDEQFKGYLRGNAIKYLFRCERKGSPLENAQKCAWYIKRLIAEYELDEETRRDVND